MGATYTVEGELPRGGAVVSNHLSYLDVLLYSAITPFVMVAKTEVRGWPVIGALTAQAGTVYVQRSEDVPAGTARQSHAEVNSRMAEAYASGLPVLFFPEGTTTKGGGVLPFRRGLFHSVLQGDVGMCPAALHLELSGENAPATVADHVCFTGNALLVPHLFRLLGLRGVTARVRFGDEIVTRADRYALSEGARATVAGMCAEMQLEALQAEQQSIGEAGGCLLTASPQSAG